MSEETRQAIKEELRCMSAADQVMRQSGRWDHSLDVQHTERLKQIVAEIGWPTISLVGAIASQQAWLLVQHADHDPAFQRACLELMQAQPPDEVDARNLAYLEDRVRIGENRPQRYGTQFRVNEQGEPEPLPLEDPAQVDAWRAAVGLKTLAEYTMMVAAHLRQRQETENRREKTTGERQRTGERNARHCAP